MIYSLTVPQAVPDVEEIRVLEWHGAIDGLFEPGDLIVELETHKAVVEVRAGQRGFLRQILAPEGDWQTIGRSLGYFSDHLDDALASGSEDAKGLPVQFEVV